MPDTRTHRGPHPDDARDFASSQLAALRSAVADLSWLFTRNYSDVAALKLVGDKFQLTARQRSAVMRAAASDEACALRARSRTELSSLAGARLGIDTFNCLITIEALLGGGVVMVCRDGVLRDISSVHGTYRRVEETGPALDLVSAALASSGIAHACFYLDRPVSNSGRLGALIEERYRGAPFTVEISVRDDVDRALATNEDIVASSDSWILDHARRWCDLPSYIVASTGCAGFRIDLSGP